MEGIRNKCDFCQQQADYDGKTKMGPWAFMCRVHFEKYGIPVAGLYKELNVVGTKVCSVCGKEKSVRDFYQYTDSKGVTRYRSECIECNAEIRKRRRQTNV